MGGGREPTVSSTSTKGGILYAHLLSDTHSVTTASADSHVILSLGAGTQSSCLALMAARGDVPASYQRPRAAMFADTGLALE